jgi:translation initiation factor 1
MPKDGIVRLLRDRKGRGGKTVTLVAGLPRNAELESLASALKRLCGTGGTIRDGVIEIQGDVRDRIKPELERRGYTVKIAGG